MKKALIIAAEGSEAVCEAVAKILSLIEVESDIANHDNAMDMFFSGDYSHVIIADYSEEEKQAGGFASYRDLSSSASGQKIIRCGQEELAYDDYVNTNEIIKILTYFEEGRKKEC